MSIKTYTNRSNAQRAAKKALGGDAVSGTDFEVYEVKKGHYAWRNPGSEGAAAEPKKAAAAKQTSAAKKSAEPKAPRQKKERPLGKRAQAEADAKAGKLPTPPDFSAETHKRYRGKLEELVQMAKDGDIKGLKGYEINPCSTSPRALDRYRNLAVTALEVIDEAEATA